MYRSILAISEGGPDAAMSFGLAARIASALGGTVDAVHYSENRPGDVDIASQAMPFVKTQSDARMRGRADESQRAFQELIAPIEGATFTGGTGLTLDRLIELGRCANLVLLGRPGSDPENIAPSTVKAAIYDCARPVVIAPPSLGPAGFASVVVAWNGSVQAARALGSALPFLEKARTVTVVVAGARPEDVGVPYLERTLDRRGIVPDVEAMDPGAASGRARGRALLAYAKDKGADLLVMGAFGHGGLTNFLGLGGATAKVIAACPIPLLLAH
jgi:nucleotide-binding universal stress UspA family protein